MATQISFDFNFLYFTILFNIDNRRILKQGGLTLSIPYFRNVLLISIHFQFLNQLAEFQLVGLNCGVQFFSKGEVLCTRLFGLLAVDPVAAHKPWNSARQKYSTHCPVVVSSDRHISQCVIRPLANNRRDSDYSQSINTCFSLPCTTSPLGTLICPHLNGHCVLEFLVSSF